MRNEMQLKGIDMFLGGCPPYEQALVKLEDMLVRLGHLSEKEMIEKAHEHRKKFFDYYRARDASWMPEE
jgi:NADH:ubiquinone oxidoreductase subunit B-like Fe-S oxidoreductase